jgi:hypothetical protein
MPGWPVRRMNGRFNTRRFAIPSSGQLQRVRSGIEQQDSAGPLSLGPELSVSELITYFAPTPWLHGKGLAIGLPILFPKKGARAMDVQLGLGNGLMGFAVGLFVHSIPASWWPGWLRDLVGKK